MKRLPPVILLVFGLVILSSSAFASPRDAQWEKVQDAIKKGLPQTAITNLEPIIRDAMKEKAYPEAVKAIGQKIALEGNIQGNKPEEKIIRLETELAKAPAEMKPILETLLAHWYWQYYERNRWRFLQRTATAATPGKDFTTWDLPRLFAEIDKHFQTALSAEKFLKQTPVESWSDLLEKGTMPDAYRPSLYDFIAHEALSFYTSGEQAGAKAEDDFELSVESPGPGYPAPFSSAKEFTAPQPSDQVMTAEESERLAAMKKSPVGKAYELFRALMRFHEHDPAPQLAFAHVNLERLMWAWNTATGAEKDARYKQALEELIADQPSNEVSAMALAAEGRLLQQQTNMVAAREFALRGAKLFPESPGGKLCHNLVAEIEAKSASITTERIWNAPMPKITVAYRNVDKIYFRAIPYNWETFLRKNHHRPQNLSEAEKKQILAKAPALEWSEPLPPTTDYNSRTAEFDAPTNLSPGFYFIVASHDPAFGEKDNVVSMADVWVSELALVTRERNGGIEGFVLEGASGEPISSAEVAVWHLDQTGKRVADPTLTTDTNGFFSMKTSRNEGHLFRARHDGQEIATVDDLWNYGYYAPEEQTPRAATVFFTDRALYRPGQTIQYKGICLWVDQTKDDYRSLAGEPVTVIFADVNGKQIARATHQANDYGSFSGSFTAPRDRLMGQMSLATEGRATGVGYVHVEEYKRPKFQVTLDAPTTAPKLNETAVLHGHAMAYTGAAIDGGEVKYHVVRQVRMPPWWSWFGRGGWPMGESQEIAHGVVQTETDGSFKIEFRAIPDLKVPEKDEPTFEFEINADVTDSAGETHSANRNVRVGYTALEAVLKANDWQTDEKPVEISVETKTLDGEPQTAEGTIKVYALKSPERVQRARLNGAFPDARQSDVSGPSDRSDLSDPNNWPLGDTVTERGFSTGTNGLAKVSLSLETGAYRAILETKDRFGKRVTSKLPIQVLRPNDERLAIKIPHLLESPDWETQPGEEFMALWGTGYEQGRAFVEIEHRHKMIQRFWTAPGRTQQQIKLAVTEAMRGGFTVHVTQVRENRAYLDSRQVSVPWKNKELELKWEHFVSKLEPGQKETWTAVIQSTNGSAHDASHEPIRAAAEMVAALYDESLDQFAPHNWPGLSQVFRQDSSYIQSQFANRVDGFRYAFGAWPDRSVPAEIRYRSFPPDLVDRRVYNRHGFLGRGDYGVTTAYFGGAMDFNYAAPMAGAPAATRGLFLADSLEAPKSGLQAEALGLQAGGKPPQPSAPTASVASVIPRKNLNETAFFFPQLTSDSNGVVRMIFTMPEALTKWRFVGFAHDKKLRNGFLEAHAVTAKDLMVQPNPPRFLREGDTLEFTVKVSNQSDQEQSGTVRLNFSEMEWNDHPADDLLGNTDPDQSFSIPAKESRSFSWRIHVPDGCGFLTYKAVAASASVSDGEEGAIPVLSRRVLVTESLPLPIRGPATKKFEFTKLLKSGSSKTLKNESLTVQIVSNPSWYAVLALPYLMEYPYECSEQIFNRLYANALARNIANSDPKIHRIFEQWRNTPAVDSPLEKNQDLKAVSLEETPWLRDAQKESQAHRNVGILFDDNRLDYEIDRTLEKLAQMQLSDGSWPWFPGGRENEYITLYIVTGFGRLRHLGVDVKIQPALRSLQRLDQWMTENYIEIQKNYKKPEDYVPTSYDALYLYGRSFFLKDKPIASEHEKAVKFYLAQARKFWLQTNCRQTQGQLAIGLKRFAGAYSLNDTTPQDILKSLKERSVSNEEMGMFWRDTELSWWWYQAPIETQALMIEAFDEVVHDDKAVEDCKVWLLKQKQTQNWKTTKATADAVYALLLRGRDLLSSDALVEVSLAGRDVTPGKGHGTKGTDGTDGIEPGTGFYEVRFAGSEIKPKLGEITVKKMDEGVAWGSMHWQYLEDISKVTPHEGTPLKLKKSLYVKKQSSKGPVLEEVKGALRVGDELVTRIELRTDRDMEYVHMKDQRGSGLEPVNVLSQYHYQDGLAYYESTRDTASHFFMDYLPKGVYVFEYSTRVVHKGEYQSGITEIQCMYAPEFNSHSESELLRVN